MRLRSILLASLVALAPTAAWAGPPFLTDDPEPVDQGHWEIYAPMTDIEGRGKDFEGTHELEFNYGAARDLQLSLVVPAAFTHDASGWRHGMGDLEVSAKYRFYHNEAAGIQAAIYPTMTLPTGTNGMGSGHVTGFVPIWLQKDAGAWSIFGGGGYVIDHGVGTHDYVTEGVAVTRQVSERLLLGVEIDHEGSAAEDENGSTSLGVGAIYHLSGPVNLLASGGPTFEDHHGGTGFHALVALGFDF